MSKRLRQEQARAVTRTLSLRDEPPVGGDSIGMADQELAARCRRALFGEPLILPGSLNVFVEDGCVTLTGRVWHSIQQQAAVDTVENVEGVLRVEECILVADQPQANT